MANTNLPLSPHLGVYRFPMAAVLSIMHRITGFGLALGALVLTWWLLAGMTGAEAYACFLRFAHSLIGELMLFCWVYALSFHFMNGIRHLVWDTGRGISIKGAKIGNCVVIVLSFVMTGYLWLAP